MRIAELDLSSLPLAELAARASEPDDIPGVGAVCALTVQLSAALITGAARGSADQWQAAGGTAAQAEALRERAAALAGQNASDYRQALEALRVTLAGGELGDDALAAALDAAAETPMRVAEVAADVAGLAAAAAGDAAAELRPDACGAAQLAAAAATTAAGLVRVNLLTREDDPRLAEAEACASRAASSARDALASVARL